MCYSIKFSRTLLYGNSYYVDVLLYARLAWEILVLFVFGCLIYLDVLEDFY